MKKMKRILAILLSALVFTSTLTVYATEINEVSIQIDDCSELNFNDFAEYNAVLVKDGIMEQRAKSNKSLYFKHYFQDGGASWSDDIMQTCNKTIASSGCCLTSFTMIQRYYGGSDDPGAVNTKLGTAACPFVYSTAASKYNLTISGFTSETVSDSYATSYIIGAISANKPVLVGLHTDSGSGTHFVAAYGYSGNTIYIHDPASNRNYTTLDSYLSSYYVNRLVVFN